MRGVRRGLRGHVGGGGGVGRYTWSNLMSQ